MQRIKIIDSHTGGEPTRVIVGGAPELGDGSLREQLNRFRESFDHIRTATILEPRGSDVLVGALLCEPTDPSCAAGVIFFNNAGYLHMCGHGTIGFAVTLLHMGRISPGVHKIETPVGIVTANLLDDHRVSVENVPSYRYRKAVSVNVAGHGDVVGDIAWGGNWFFLVADHGKDLATTSTRDLTDFTLEIRVALQKENVTGSDGGEIDHIELFGPPVDAGQNHSRNFVLCPGGAFDRSPCGTGTSAKLACLAADEKLSPGETWRQESIVGSAFEGSYILDNSGRLSDNEGVTVIPTITGSAWITAESELLLDPSDPFKAGFEL